MSMTDIYPLLEEVYLEMAGSYGSPVLAGNRKIWGFEGIFERLNEKLRRLRKRTLSWDEFVELLRKLDAPKYWGKVYVTFVISPRGKVEPHDITFFSPTFVRRAWL